MVEGAGAVEHVAHVDDAADVPSERLVEGGGAVEHVDHASDAAHVEGERLVEGDGLAEHVAHVGDAPRVKGKRLRAVVEGSGAEEHGSRVGDAARVPPRQVLVEVGEVVEETLPEVNPAEARHGRHVPRARRAVRVECLRCVVVPRGQRRPQLLFIVRYEVRRGAR